MYSDAQGDARKASMLHEARNASCSSWMCKRRKDAGDLTVNISGYWRASKNSRRLIYVLQNTRKPLTVSIMKRHRLL